MAEKWYRLYCDNCGYNRWTNGTNIGDLVQHKRSPIQKNIPSLDSVTNKPVAGNTFDLPRQFKCPKCGYLIKPRKYKMPQEANDEQNNTERSEESPGGPSVS